MVDMSQELNRAAQAKPHYFLIVASPSMLYPSGKQNAFYVTGSLVVAERLLELFRRRKPDPAVDAFPLATFEIVNGGNLEFLDRMYYWEDIDVLEEIASIGDWDPQIWADAGLPHDQWTVFGMSCYDLARRWERLIREDLRTDATGTHRDAQRQRGVQARPVAEPERPGLEADLDELARGPRGTATEETDGYPVWKLRDMIGVSSGTVNTYAKQAGVATPDRGQRNYRYTLDEARTILEWTKANSPTKQARERAESALKTLPEITK
jgi:hypothetical protein